jgi:hypothetical protein
MPVVANGSSKLIRGAIASSTMVIEWRVVEIPVAITVTLWPPSEISSDVDVEKFVVFGEYARQVWPSMRIRTDSTGPTD